MYYTLKFVKRINLTLRILATTKIIKNFKEWCNEYGNRFH